MSTHDEFQKLSARAIKAEDNVKTASATNMDDLRKRVQEAGDSAQTRAMGLKTRVANAKQKASHDWDDVQDRWSAHVASMRSDAADHKDRHYSKHAEHRAEKAERNAEETVAFAYAAIEESEYAVLDAALARAEADQAAATVA
jgi:hypothetical protein